MSRVVEVEPERYEAWLSRFRDNNPEPDPAQRLGSVEPFDHPRVALLLVRRGGYAVGVGDGDRLSAHKVGSRYVQSRTAAGGWSQQRFARRRGNQADALVSAVADQMVRLVAGAGATGLVVGGDRPLVAQVLLDRRLAAVAALERRELYDLPDPSLAVLERALRRGRSVRVEVVDLR